MNLNKLSIREIETINLKEETNLSIEKQLPIDKLVALNELLGKHNNNVKLVIVVDMNAIINEGCIGNLDVLNFLPNVKRLSILSNSSHSLENINAISKVNDLALFHLQGFYKKTISVEPLKKFTNMTDLVLEYGLVNEKQYNFVNSLTNLQKLRVSVLDLSIVNQKEKLIDLHIGSTIKNADLMNEIFPNLSRLKINQFKGSEDFSFISKMEKIENISFCYTSKFEKFTKIHNPSLIKSIELLSVPNFSDIESILTFKNLEHLSITDLAKFPAKEFVKLKTLKKLKSVYIYFKSKKENEGFEEIRRSAAWEFKNIW